MKVVKLPLSDLKKPERNVRMHTEKQLKEFVRSIEMFGQIRPIVVDEDGTILAGNGLYEALKRMGQEKADVLKVTGLSGNQKKKLMLADNKIFGLGVDDLESFDAFLEELKDDLDIPGFDEELLQSMVAEASAVTERLQEYGTLDTEEIEEIRAARERKETLMASGAAAPYGNEDEGGAEIPDSEPGAETRPAVADAGRNDEAPSDNGEREPVRRSVICPHCGGTVWL